jgi:exosortase B
MRSGGGNQLPAWTWRHWPAWVLLGSLLAITLPSYLMLAARVWPSDEQGHGPIILAVTLWLAWRNRASLLALPEAPVPVVGWATMLLGMVGYAIGRSQAVDTIEVLSHIPILAAALLLTKGWKGLRWGAFYLFFLLFMVPLPGIFVQTITTPLKIAVSHVAELLLHLGNYPVARTGVILYVGQYQMLVADACAGLNSMFTLEALGLLYLNLMQSTSMARNAALAVLVIPIAFVANVARVILLVLVTFYLGDEAGQGFVHGFAGMVLFMIGLGLMLAADSGLMRLFPGRASHLVASSA